MEKLKIDGFIHKMKKEQITEKKVARIERRWNLWEGKREGFFIIEEAKDMIERLFCGKYYKDETLPKKQTLDKCGRNFLGEPFLCPKCQKLKERLEKIK